MKSKEHTWQTFERRLRARLLGPKIDDQVAEEIDFHVAMLARELEESGMTQAQARAEAAQRFDDRTQVASACARIAQGTERRWRWRILLGELHDDVRYALRQQRFTVLNLADGDRPERVLAAPVTHDFFAVFGVPPRLGRTFTAQEDQPAAEPVVVISDALWRNRLGSDPAVLQRTLHLSGRAFKVIGVMPAGFDPTLSQEELWLPIAFTPAERSQHDNHFLDVLGLLQPHASPAAAQAELSVAMRHLAQRYPDANYGRTGVRIQPLAEYLIGSYRRRLLVLLGAVGLVLLIACANVASLLLARGSGRAHELAIRAAVGAGASRIVRQLLGESAVLALAGGALGLAFAEAAVRLLLPLAPAGIPRLGETRIDASVLLFTLLVSLAASLLFGMAPALRSARQDPQTLLRAGAAGTGPARDRLRSLLVAAEVGLALTLLVGAGLLIRSDLHLRRTAPSPATTSPAESGS